MDAILCVEARSTVFALMLVNGLASIALCVGVGLSTLGGCGSEGGTLVGCVCSPGCVTCTIEVVYDFLLYR